VKVTLTIDDDKFAEAQSYDNSLTEDRMSEAIKETVASIITEQMENQKRRQEREDRRKKHYAAKESVAVDLD